MMKPFHRTLLTSLLLCSVGCFKPAGPKPTADATTPPAAATTEAVAPRETLNEKTQNVLKLEGALEHGGVLASTQATETDPLLQSAAAYRTSVAKLGAMAVHQAIQIRNAQSINDPKPLTYEKFMAEIIKVGEPDGIQLAMLPYYQEYAWDEKAQALIVVDFPARKAERQKQLDSN